MHKYGLAYSILLIVFPMASASIPYHILQIRQQAGSNPLVQPLPSSSPSPPTSPTHISPSPPITPPSTPIISSIPQNLPTQPSSSPPPSLPTSLSISSTPTALTSQSDLSNSITSTSTDSAGQPITVTVPASSSSSAAPSPTQSDSGSDGSLKSGGIIGLSVAGGLAAIGVIAFIIWKVTRKRFSDLDDPDEAIKWPELRRESPIGGEDLANVSSRNPSTLNQAEYADPYAVPPLPQHNPNQPYRDDPNAYGASGYYDPYRGPVPQSIHEGSVDGHESIPMSTYPPGSRTRSPGPGPSYDLGGRGSPAPGRASPGPGALYDTGGRGSPAPGRAISPGPAAVLGLDRRPSPAPPGGQPEMASRNQAQPPPNILG